MRPDGSGETVPLMQSLAHQELARALAAERRLEGERRSRGRKDGPARPKRSASTVARSPSMEDAAALGIPYTTSDQPRPPRTGADPRAANR